ncbi:Zinc finger CCCH domain-containing protein [Vigna angularis]|uniref:Zinc finger CCCH domain-containing protein n=1 Tax=Phaseolus angularis TaxID=3914 RepID=A0A8T0JQC5_PHAAN|nr:Zinc finger CCCH domain-containing protein [Vigna angularis]
MSRCKRRKFITELRRITSAENNEACWSRKGCAVTRSGVVKDIDFKVECSRDGIACMTVKLNSCRGDYLFTMVSCDNGEVRRNVAIWLINVVGIVVAESSRESSKGAEEDGAYMDGMVRESEPSPFAMAFPPYRRSHLRSNTYHALVHLLSHFAEYNSSHETSIQPFNIPDDGIGRMDREIIEGVGDKDTDFPSNKIVLDDIEHMLEIEDMPTQVNGDLIPMNTEFDEKHNDGREVGLMDSQVDMEEGEISGDLGKDGNSCDVPSADALILPQKQVDDLQEPKRRKIKEDKMKVFFKLNVQPAFKRNKRGGKKDKKKFVQKPKAVSHCRHYIMGRCYEGDKCQFSHDVVPRTKSKPCGHFAHNSCMKGNDCPFDHELSKYPCNNILSQGFCRRGESCLFSHQVSKEDIPSNIPTPSNMRRPVLSTLQSGNANSSTPVSNNHGSGTMQQNLLTHSSGIHSRVNVEHKATNTAQKQPTPPKGISFINLAKFTPSPSALKQGTVTIKESPLQTGMHEEQRAFNKSQNKVEIAKKLPSVTPKGVNFLSFGKGSVSGSKTHIHPNLSTENGFNLPRLLNFGLPEQIKKDVHDKPSDRTQQSVSLSDIFLNEILGKNQSVSEGVKSKFPDKTSHDQRTLQKSSVEVSNHAALGDWNQGYDRSNLVLAVLEVINTGSMLRVTCSCQWIKVWTEAANLVAQLNLEQAGYVI